MIVWAGYDGNNGVNTGGKYNPGTNSWTATTTTNAPEAQIRSPGGVDGERNDYLGWHW